MSCGLLGKRVRGHLIQASEQGYPRTQSKRSGHSGPREEGWAPQAQAKGLHFRKA